MYKKILAGVDGSDTSMKALKHAIELAEIHDSKLHIISVLGEFKLPFASQYELWASESRDEQVSKVLEEMNSAIMSIKKEDVEIEVETRIEEGKPPLLSRISRSDDLTAYFLELVHEVDVVLHCLVELP